MNCLTKLFQQKRRRIGYILAFSGPMISKRDSSDPGYKPQTENVTVGSDAPSAKEAAKNPVKAASDGVKGLFNKGKGLFKKKDKK